MTIKKIFFAMAIILQSILLTATVTSPIWIIAVACNKYNTEREQLKKVRPLEWRDAQYGMCWSEFLSKVDRPDDFWLVESKKEYNKYRVYNRYITVRRDTIVAIWSK